MFSSDISELFSAVLDAIAPPRRTEKIVRTLSLTELYSLASTPRTDEVYAAGAGEGEHVSILPYHDTSVAALVWEVKYYASPRAQKLAGTLLADTLMDIAAEEVGRVVLIPIPIHPKRRKERGHNQTELLCEAALKQLSGENSRESSFDYRPDLLARVRHTAPQQGLPKHRRLKNVKNTMEIVEIKDAENTKNTKVNRENVKDRVCIVVDDVATTGATFAEARRALRASGARRIYCVALAGA